MNKTKFLASLVAAIMLLTTLSTTLVSAAAPTALEEIVTHANFTINNNIDSTGITIKDKTYNLYQVFSATTMHDPDDNVDDTVKYTVNPNFYGFFTDKEYATGKVVGPYPTSGKEADITIYNSNAQEYVSNHADLPEIVALLRDYIANNNIAPTTTTGNYVLSGNEVDETQVAENVELGYYAVFDSLAITGGVGADDAVTNGSLVRIPGRATDGTLTADVEKTLKGNMPEIDKDIWHNDLTGVDGVKLPNDKTANGTWDDVADYQIGDKVHFRIECVLPANVDNYKTYEYIVTDTLSKGLSFNYDIKIYQDAELTEGPVPGNLHEESFGDLTDDDKTNDYTFKLDFEMLKIKAAYPSLKKFYIYYTATVTEDAVIAPSHEDNTVTLDFSNNPYNESSKGKDKDKVYGYTFNMNVLKTKGDGVTPLAGATFALFEEKTVDDQLVKTQIYLSQKTGADVTVPTYFPAVGDASNEAGVIVTDDTGKINIIGLDDSKTYVLEEVKAPNGYNAADPISFKFTVTYTEDKINKIPVPTITVSGDVDNNEITVINTSASLLPETGGMGTTIFTITGIIIMLSAGAILFLTKSKKTSK